MIDMFRGLHNARFVRISSETIEVLNLVPGLQARQTCPFKRLKSLKVHGEDNSFVIPDHVQIYLLGDELPEETLHMEGSFLAEPGDHTDHLSTSLLADLTRL